MILIMYSSLRGSNLGLAQRCLSGWRILQPAKSSAPSTADIVLATAWYLTRHGHIEASITLCVTFFACLRVSEALGLQEEDKAFPGGRPAGSVRFPCRRSLHSRRQNRPIHRLPPVREARESPLHCISRQLDKGIQKNGMGLLCISLINPMQRS